MNIANNKAHNEWALFSSDSQWSDQPELDESLLEELDSEFVDRLLPKFESEDPLLMLEDSTPELLDADSEDELEDCWLL